MAKWPRAAIERMLREAAEGCTNPVHPPGCLVISAAVDVGEADADVKLELRGFREQAKVRIAPAVVPSPAHRPARTCLPTTARRRGSRHRCCVTR
jgi:hypothetical protein